MEIVIGSIVEQQVDVIVNSTIKSLSLKDSGALSKLILEKAGPKLQEECNSSFPKGIPDADIAVTSGHNLPCKEIYHIACPEWDGGAGASGLMKVVESCIELAGKNNRNSIAFPAIGARGRGFPSRQVARCMLEGYLTQLVTDEAVTPSDVRVVLHPSDVAIIKAFHLEFDGAADIANTHASSESHSAGGNLAPVKPGIKSTLALRGGGKLELVVESIETRKVDIVVNTTSKSLNPDDAGAVSRVIHQTAGPELLAECQNKYKAGIQEGDLAITGGHKMPCKKIYHINTPAWHKDTSSKYLEDITRKCLNQATKDGCSSIAFPSIGTGGRGYHAQVVAPSMTTTVITHFRQNRPPALVNVQFIMYRGDRSAIQAFTDEFEEAAKRDVMAGYPDTWEEMDTEEDFEEHVVDPSSEEYKTIASKFSRGNRGTTLLTITRIQNKLLYKKYQVHKEGLVKRHPDCERTLWHGTSADTTKNISKLGFNRSYCGKNATSFGQGVYFAVSSRYSAADKYARPDADGAQLIYMVQVLTGLYTVGNNTMRVPPPMDKSDPTERFDTLVNDIKSPSIFVTFHDDQAYPEYLIKFKSR